MSRKGRKVPILTSRLSEAFDRINILESLEGTKQLKEERQREFKRLAKIAVEIYALKEKFEVYNPELYDAASMEEFEDKLNDLLEEHELMHQMLIAQQSIKKSVEDAICQTQMQDAVYEPIQNNNINDPETTRQILNICENNEEYLTVCRSNVDEMEEYYKLNEASIDLRMKYKETLHSIAQKIDKVSEEGIKKKIMQDAEYKKMENKIAKREERLIIMANIVRNLIACSGIQYGLNPRLLQTLMLCDQIHMSDINSYIESDNELKRLETEVTTSSKAANQMESGDKLLLKWLQKRTNEDNTD